MKKQILVFLSIGIAGILLINSCKKDEPVPVNPYDSINYGDDTPEPDTVDPASLVGLHRNLFLTRCALPGCHDGVFEPDFRTIQSTYSTMVYAPVKKNNAANSFTYRVVPGDTAMSVLYERITNCCFVNEDDRMPQDNIGTALPASDIQHVGQWIMNGAKNVDGEVSTRPDLEPVVQYYFAANSTFDIELSAETNRLDSLIYNPFYIPSGTSSFYIAVPVTDDITPTGELLVNKLYLSTSQDNFAGAIMLTATFFNIPGQDPIWLVTVPTSGLTAGAQYFMRYYVNDGHHAQNTEFPETTSNPFYKSYWSFILQP